MRQLTPKQYIDAFTQTYSDLYQDICKYSHQKRIPMAVWFLSHNFKNVTAYQLDNTEKDNNPFFTVKAIIRKDKPIAYVLGGQAMMVKKIFNKDGSTDKDIDSKCDDDECGLFDGSDKADESIAKDKNRFETLIIASSRIDIPDLEFGTPEMFPKNTIDRLAMYVVNRKHDNVDLKIEADVKHDRIGINNMVNILGEKFGLRRK